jgi:hypothetical protein
MDFQTKPLKQLDLFKDQPRHCIEKQMQLGEVFTVTWLEYQFKVDHNPHKCYFTNEIIKRGGKRCMPYLEAVRLKYHVDTFLRGAVKAAKIKKRILQSMD